MILLPLIFLYSYGTYVHLVLNLLYSSFDVSPFLCMVHFDRLHVEKSEKYYSRRPFSHMISLFQVKVTKREEGKKDEKFIRNLHKGDFFGEKALQG